MALEPRATDALRLTLAGLAVAVGRVGLSSDGFSTPARAALVDLGGGLAAAGALWGVLAIRWLASGRRHEDVLLEGLHAAAGVAWLFALVPPRPSNYWPSGGTDDFALAWVPACLAAVILARLGTWCFPGASRLALGRRHLFSLGWLCLGQGALVRLLIGGPGATSAWHAALLLSALCAGALAATWPMGHRRA